MGTRGNWIAKDEEDVMTMSKKGSLYARRYEKRQIYMYEYGKNGNNKCLLCEFVESSKNIIVNSFHFQSFVSYIYKIRCSTSERGCLRLFKDSIPSTRERQRSRRMEHYSPVFEQRKGINL